MATKIDWMAKSWKQQDFTDKVDILTGRKDIEDYGEFAIAVHNLDRHRHMGDAELGSMAIDLFNRIDPNALTADLAARYTEIENILYQPIDG